MQDTTQKGNIDLDDLVNTLMRERTGGTAGLSIEPEDDRQDEIRGDLSPADIFAAILAENPDSDDEDEGDVVEKNQSLLLSMEEEQGLKESVPVAAALQHTLEAPVVISSEEPAEETEEKAPPAPPIAEKKNGEKKRLFARRRREPEMTPEEDWADWGLKPIGHYKVSESEEQTNDSVSPVDIPTEETVVEPVETPAISEDVQEADYHQASPVIDEFPSVQPVDETITMTIPIPVPTEATRVIEVSDAPSSGEVVSAAPPMDEAIEDQLPDQLSMEEMVRVEEMEEQPEGVDEDPNQRLQRTRLEKIREFTINGEEEEANEPEEEAVPDEPEEEAEIEDFTDYQDTRAVQHELRYRCRTAALSMLFTGLLELVLLLLTIITVSVGSSPITGLGYLTVQLFGLGLMLVLNFATVSRGLSGLLHLSANGDSGPSLAVVTVMVSILPYFADSTQSLPVWAPVAGLLMFFSACAQYLQARRVMRNFAFVSYPAAKYAANIVEDEKALHEIGRCAAMETDATISYFRRTAFLSDYLASAYEPDNSADWARWTTPMALLLSLVLSVTLTAMGYLVGFWSWLQTFVGMLCLSMPALSLAVQLPMSSCCRRMMARGGFMVGWKAVRRFGCPDGLAVDVADLYPDESMLLHGIKTFSGTHIDDAILDAASLSVRAGGPLSLIFRRIIENKEELLHEVDSLVYEQGMGVSGWVDGRRVLVGNRRLLENHGVDVPSSDYEARYAKDGRRLVYLSTAGELSAMFVVSYLPDESIKQALQQLCRSKMMLLIRSCDQNITAESLCADFNLPEYYVDVLPSVAGRLYTELTEGESESAPAELASNGHILGTAQAISACRNLHIRSVVALLTHTILAAIGLILAVIWAVEGSVLLFLGTFGVTLSSAMLAWIIPLFKRL